MGDKLIFVHAKDGHKFINDAICGSCGQEVPIEELLVLDPASASARGGGIRPAMPSEVDYFARTRQYPAQPSKAEEAEALKKQASFQSGFEDRIGVIVAKALIAAQKGAKK